MQNWWRVLGTAELPHIDQGVRHQFHAEMSLLNALKTQEESLEFILPRKGPVDAGPHPNHWRRLSATGARIAAEAVGLCP